MRRRLALFLAAACAAAVTTPATARPPRFDKPVLIPVREDGTREPRIAIDLAGRIFVMAPHVSNYTMPSRMWRSTDGGRTFGELTPSPGGVDIPGSGGFSADIVAGPLDTMYAVDHTSLTATFAESGDHGDSWIVRPAVHVPVGMRDWLGYSIRDDALYEVYDGVGGVWFAQPGRAPSDPAAPVLIGDGGQVGRPGIDRRTGAIYVCYATAGTRASPTCAASRDKGQTWSSSRLPFMGDIDRPPSVAVDPAGNVFAAWSDMAGVYLAESRDRGRTWRGRFVGSSTVGPGLAILGTGRPAIAWPEEEPGMRVTVRYAEYPDFWSSGRSVTATVDHAATMLAGFGDFLSMATARNGDLYVAYSIAEMDAVTVRVARLPRH